VVVLAGVYIMERGKKKEEGGKNKIKGEEKR
jgi:hypothetical protein